MKVTAKCRNYSGCLLAYRGEDIEIADGAPMVCPDCGKPVTPSTSAGSRIGIIAGAVVLLAIVVAGAVLALPKLLRKSPTPEPAGTVAVTPAATPPASTPPAGGKAPSPRLTVKPAEPPKALVSPAKLDLNVGSNETQKVKTEVLTRIDAMPNISQANKDKLYNSVQRARSMGKVLTIPFASGRTALSSAEVQEMKERLDAPEVLRLRDDPTAVFVILGYADPKGDAQKNIDFSQARADAVLAAMRDKCGIQNVMHAVAMGGSTLLDAQDLEKNRIAEIWAVLP